MIFSIEDHIEQIIAGTKTQTRRSMNRYTTGRAYSIQPGRGKKGIPDGKISIVGTRRERKSSWYDYPITDVGAKREGGYTIDEFEELYEKMYPSWKERWAYSFFFVPHSSSGKVKTNA